MPGLLDGRVVVVAGAGGGIGRAVAVAVAEQGGRVVVGDAGIPHHGGPPSDTVARQVVDQVREAGSDAVHVVDSIATVAGARSLVEAALDTWGRLDGAVCCQAIQSDKLMVEYHEAEWTAMIATHLTGHFTVYQAAARAMIAAGTGGAIVGFGSGYVQGTVRRSAYRAAKAGVIGLTKSAALELAEHGIRVNCVMPSANTRMTEAMKVLADGEPADVAPLVVYLLSDLARAVTGQAISISGSRIAGWSDPFQNRFAARDGRWTPEDLARDVPFVLGSERVGTPVGTL